MLECEWKARPLPPRLPCKRAASNTKLPLTSLQRKQDPIDSTAAKDAKRLELSQMVAARSAQILQQRAAGSSPNTARGSIKVVDSEDEAEFSSPVPGIPPDDAMDIDDDEEEWLGIAPQEDSVPEQDASFRADSADEQDDGSLADQDGGGSRASSDRDDAGSEDEWSGITNTVDSDDQHVVLVRRDGAELGRGVLLDKDALKRNEMYILNGWKGTSVGGRNMSTHISQTSMQLQSLIPSQT